MKRFFAVFAVVFALFFTVCGRAYADDFDYGSDFASRVHSARGAYHLDDCVISFNGQALRDMKNTPNSLHVNSIRAACGVHKVNDKDGL